MDPQRTGQTFEAISPLVLLMYVIMSIRLARSGGIKGGGDMGAFPPPVGGFAPTCPPPRQKEKLSKSAIFGKFLDFCAPSETHLLLLFITANGSVDRWHNLKVWGHGPWTHKGLVGPLRPSVPLSY